MEVEYISNLSDPKQPDFGVYSVLITGMESWQEKKDFLLPFTVVWVKALSWGHVPCTHLRVHLFTLEEVLMFNLRFKEYIDDNLV